MRSLTNNVAQTMIKNIKLNNGFTVNVGFVLILTAFMVCLNIWIRLQSPPTTTEETSDKGGH